MISSRSWFDKLTTNGDNPLVLSDDASLIETPDEVGELVKG